ncbi:U2 snRNP complex subunit msl1 [Ascosphaera pollenicola]|nr:U2 snRNP complex subunit msl1 [Ascosphaera pollenicola]
MAAKPASLPQSLGTPNQTLYCTNLPDKIKKPDMRTALYMLFSTYGPVLDVVAMRTAKMRGQAHIVFRDIHTSTQAMRALQGFEFFGKPMKIVYAKGSSDIIAKLRGTYVPPSTVPPPVGGPGVQTELQRTIFNAPPSSTAAAKPDASKDAAPQGTKRPREEESDEEDAPMDEDSDAPMEASSDED